MKTHPVQDSGSTTPPVFALSIGTVPQNTTSELLRCLHLKPQRKKWSQNHFMTKGSTNGLDPTMLYHTRTQRDLIYLDFVVLLDFRLNGIKITTDVIRQEAERKAMSGEIKN